MEIAAMMRGSMMIGLLTGAFTAVPAAAQDAGTRVTDPDGGDAGGADDRATEGGDPGYAPDSTNCSATCDIWASPTYCNINCPTSSDYIIFGEIWVSAAGSPIYGRAGIGVCLFESDGLYGRGDFVGHAVAPYDVVDYRVRADGTSAYGGNDLVRLATPGGMETCRPHGPGVGGVAIRGVLQSNDTFLFWGDGGNDALFLCSYTNDPYYYGDCASQRPSTHTYCIQSPGRADGRGGDDHVYGSPWGDWLWGGDGRDQICGYPGEDVLLGGDGPDSLYGGAASDILEGGPGDDYLWGDEVGYPDANDYLFGDLYHGPNTGEDFCNCGVEGGGVSANYCADANCEVEYCNATCP